MSITKNEVERYISKRTFGLEIEMCNFDKAKVHLPCGFSWSEEETIFNTNSKSSKHFGGEINTPPLVLCQEDRDKVRNIYSQLIEAGGVLKWSIDLHVYIFAGDLGLEELKRIFYLLYHCYPYIKESFNISDWDELVFNAQPLPLEKHYNAVRLSKDLNALKDVFINQSAKGYLRMAINIASFFKRGTIEFRCFRATDKIEELEDCVLASYRILNYAITHTEEEIKAIASLQEFKRKLKIDNKVFPRQLIPLIYQGNPYSPKECFLTKPISVNGQLLNALLKEELQSVAIVGDLGYSLALSIWHRAKIKIYSQDILLHTFHQIAINNLVIEYKDKLSWLQQYSEETAIRQIALCLFISKIRRYISPKNEYEEVKLSGYRKEALRSILKIEENAKDLLEMLKQVEVINGTLDTAFDNKEPNIVYQFGIDKHSKPTYRIISQNSDLEIEIEQQDLDFYQLVERIPQETIFYFFSNSPYLSNLHKIAHIKRGAGKNMGSYLYTNKLKTYGKSSFKSVPTKEAIINIPPNDLKITDASKLRIYQIPAKELYSLQQQFIKKVDNLSLCTFAFVVMYDGYCLGGTGFKFPLPGQNADLWQLTDFATNNNIPKASKLILACIRSSPMQRLLSRVMGKLITSVITFIYTQNPISMKYRGEYTKDKEASSVGRLVYRADIGEYKDYQEIIDRYNKLTK